jgi:hypothetical protein
MADIVPIAKIIMVFCNIRYELVVRKNLFLNKTRAQNEKQRHSITNNWIINLKFRKLQYTVSFLFY